MSADDLYQTLVAYSISPFVLWWAIFFLTFVLEEGAAALAVLLILAHKLSWPLASTAVFMGVVASDLALYGCGYAASHFKWVRRWIDVVKLRQGDEWMQQTLLPAVILCRFLPWALPPVFIACGFFGLSFLRVLWLSAFSAALWTVVVVGFMLEFSIVLLEHDQFWTWGAALIGLWLFTLWNIRRTRALKTHAGRLKTTRVPTNLALADLPLPVSWPENQTVCWFERMPAWLFYLPIVLLWLLLSLRYRSLTLPTAANPSFEAGGLVGESKLQVMSQVSASVMEWFAPHTALTRSDEHGVPAADTQRAMRALAAGGLEFPIVAKPDRGHHGHGVHPIASEEELGAYISVFPPGETMMLQTLVPLNGEAGVFYIRPPGHVSGQIFSMNFSEPAQVIGDGITTLRTLIEVHPSMAHSQGIHLAAQLDRLDWIPPAGEHVLLAFARSHRLGAILTDGRQCVTPALLKRFDLIADGIKDFHFGRFEVRFRQLDEFQRGEGFQIVEINGVGAEANHIWDRNSRLHDAYRTLFTQYHLAFKIGDENRRNGAKPMPLKRLWATFRTQQRLLRQFAQTDPGLPIRR